MKQLNVWKPGNNIVFLLRPATINANLYRAFFSTLWFNFFDKIIQIQGNMNMQTYKYEVADVATTLDSIRKKASEKNGVVEGDNTSGTITGNGIKSNYIIEGNSISITVTEKPAFIPWSLVEKKLNDYIK